MELRQNRTRISKRIPLSNLTNAQSLSSSSSSSALTLKPKPKPSDPRSALSSNSKLAYVSDSRSSSSISSRGLKSPSHRRIPNSDRPVNEKSSDLGNFFCLNFRVSCDEQVRVGDTLWTTSDLSFVC